MINFLYIVVIFKGINKPFKISKSSGKAQLQIEIISQFALVQNSVIPAASAPRFLYEGQQVQYK